MPDLGFALTPLSYLSCEQFRKQPGETHWVFAPADSRDIGGRHSKVVGRSPEMRMFVAILSLD